MRNLNKDRGNLKGIGKSKLITGHNPRKLKKITQKQQYGTLQDYKYQIDINLLAPEFYI
jgi:hypothetical protein